MTVTSIWSREEAAEYVSKQYYGGKYIDSSHEHLSRDLHCLPNGGYRVEDVKDMVARMIRLRDVCKIIGH